MRAVLTLILSLVTMCAFATKYTGIIAFGDSLTDAGNHPISHITPLVPVTNPYQGSTKQYGGSSGIVWVQLLQRDLYQQGLVPDPIIHLSKNWKPADRSINYAWASAVAGNDFTNDKGDIQKKCTTPSAKPLCIPGVQSQVALYLKQHHGKADSKALFIIWGGANDLINNTRNLFTHRWGQFVSYPAHQIAQAANTLVQAGAKHLVIIDIPDISLVPGLKRHGLIDYIVQYITLRFNSRLLEQLQHSPYLKNIDWKLVRVSESFYRAYYRNGNYAELFTNVTDECEDYPQAIKKNCAGFLFWNDKHPALPAERVIAKLVLNQIVN